MMTSVKPRTVISNLKRKGFTDNWEKDHIRLTLKIDGRSTQIRTMISHNSNDIGDDLIAKMARQLKIDKDTFIDLVSCHIDGETYVRILRDNKVPV